MTDQRTIDGKRLPKLCGADIELGNFVLGSNRRGSTCGDASRALLAEIDGLPPAAAYQPSLWDCSERRSDGFRVAGLAGYGWQGGYNPQDWGRKFLPGNGGCVYIDLDHLEVCLPEVLSAWDHVACWHAMLRIARRALEAANRGLPAGQRIQVLVNNSDGLGNSYGSHLNFLLARRAWENIFHRKMQYLLYLAAYQASSILFTGQGKAGSENGRPAVEFQISQRADFFETLLGVQTTYNRPVVNSRDEALCGRRRDEEMARLHVIFFDNTLCHVASLLKVGVTQIVLSMLEAGRINPGVLLDDPVEAVVRWSHDPGLKARAATISGKRLTALEVQQIMLEDARMFVASGGCDGLVPRAREIVALWEDTLAKLAAHDFSALARRLDWVLKLYILGRTLEQRPDLDWTSPQIKHLDHLYSSLDPEEGLYWAYERKGLVERVAEDAEIERFTQEPPEDTRAWTRAMLLRRDPRSVEEVDWDSVRLRTSGRRWSCVRTLRLDNPLEFTRRDCETVFRDAATVDEVADALDEMNPTQAGSLRHVGQASDLPCERRRLIQ